MLWPGYTGAESQAARFRPGSTVRRCSPLRSSGLSPDTHGPLGRECLSRHPRSTRVRASLPTPTVHAGGASLPTPTVHAGGNIPCAAERVFICMKHVPASVFATKTPGLEGQVFGQSVEQKTRPRGPAWLPQGRWRLPGRRVCAVRLAGF